MRIFTLFVLGAIVLGSAAQADVRFERFKLIPNDGAAGDRFGCSVAIAGEYIVVGSPNDDVNGTSSGCAFVFDAVTGQQVLELLPDDGAAQASFGWAVDISGTVAIVGAEGQADNGLNAGAVYLFDVQTGSQLAKFLPVDGAAGDVFGRAVALDGSMAIIGSCWHDDAGNNSGAAYLFDAVLFQQLDELHPLIAVPGDQFGFSVDLSGTVAVVSSMRLDHSGSTYLFDSTTGEQVLELVPENGMPTDQFGYDVAIDGPLVVVGARADDTNGLWSGAAYLFDVMTGDQVFKLFASDGAANDQFASSVDIGGDIVLIGAPSDDDNGYGSGSAFLFNATSGQQVAKLLPSDGMPGDAFGGAVDVDGSRAVIGADRDDPAGGESGSAYVFNVDLCPADLDGDGVVDSEDLVTVITAWGTSAGDVTDDGMTDTADLVAVIVSWGQCD